MAAARLADSEIRPELHHLTAGCQGRSRPGPVQTVTQTSRRVTGLGWPALGRPTARGPLSQLACPDPPPGPLCDRPAPHAPRTRPPARARAEGDHGRAAPGDDWRGGRRPEGALCGAGPAGRDRSPSRRRQLNGASGLGRGEGGMRETSSESRRWVTGSRGRE